jgi:hypothetical protein
MIVALGIGLALQRSPTARTTSDTSGCGCNLATRYIAIMPATSDDTVREPDSKLKFDNSTQPLDIVTFQRAHCDTCFLVHEIQCRKTPAQTF